MHTKQDPDLIRRQLNAHVESSLLHATIELRLLFPLLHQPHTLESLAEASSYTPRGVQILLQALASLNIVSKNDQNQYQLVALHRAAFDPETRFYIGATANAAQQFWGVAGDLNNAQFEKLILQAQRAVRKAPPAVAWLVERSWAYVQTASLMRLAQYDAFALLDQRAYTLSELESHSKVPPNILEPLLQTARECGVVAITNDEITLTEMARIAFGKGLIENYTHWIQQRLWMERKFFWQSLGKLPSCVRRGKSASLHSHPEGNSEFRQTFIKINRPLLPLLQQVSQKVARSLKAQARPQQILEIGAGLGNWGMVWASAHPKSQITAVDNAAALSETKHIAMTAGLSDRYTWKPDTILTTDYQQAHYDLVILNEVFHTIPPALLLDWLAHVTQAIKPGGILLIADMILDDDHAGPRRHLLASLKLFVSGGGQLMNVAGYQDCLRQVGLTHMQMVRLPTTDLLLARRPRGGT